MQESSFTLRGSTSSPNVPWAPTIRWRSAGNCPTIKICEGYAATLFGRPFVKRFALSYRTVACLSLCLSCPVCDVRVCGQTVGWIKMKLGVQVGLRPSHIVLYGDPAPPPRKWAQQPPTFEIYGRRLRLRPYNSRPVSIAAKRLDGSRCHLVRR